MDNGLRFSTDANLIMQYQLTNDSRCLGELYGRYHKKVYQYCLTFLRDKEAANDICQDIFIKVTENIGKLRINITFPAWLFRIACHACIDYAKEKSKIHHISFVDGAMDQEDETMDREELMNKDLQLETIFYLIENLTDSEKDLLKAKYVENLSIKDLQLRLGLSPSAIKMRLARVRQKLLKHYELARA